MRNTGQGSVAWRAMNTARWVHLSPQEGSLEPGESVSVNVSIVPRRAAALPAGTYRAGIAFVNATDGVGTTSRCIELIRPPEGEGVPPPSAPREEAESTRSSSLSQFGITWTFDREYEVGRFVNGDHWVRGPILVVGIDPPSRKIGQRTVNGSMINPSPRKNWTQGYDSAMYGKYRKPSAFDPTANIALGLSSTNPRLLRPHTSLVSTISDPRAGHRPQLRVAAVLTVVPAPPPAGSFRPPYVGGDKTARFNERQLDTSLLAELEPTPSAPPMSVVERWFERPWLDHVPEWVGRYTHPSSNMPDYGREIVHQVGVAALMLHLDYPLEAKRTLLVRFVQLGIDFQGIVDNGGEDNWPAGGGHHSGRKWPILFAGLVLGDAEMSAIGSKEVAFNEDDQTFYVRETSPGVYNHGQGGYGPQHVGMAEWGNQHWKQLNRGQPPTFDDVDWLSDPYRLCCTANAWWGELLAAYIMDARGLWNHEALFDYQDRYLEVNLRRGIKDYRLSWRPFPLEMWRRYRARY